MHEIPKMAATLPLFWLSTHCFSAELEGLDGFSPTAVPLYVKELDYQKLRPTAGLWFAGVSGSLSVVAGLAVIFKDGAPISTRKVGDLLVPKRVTSSGIPIPVGENELLSVEIPLAIQPDASDLDGAALRSIGFTFTFEEKDSVEIKDVLPKTELMKDNVSANATIRLCADARGKFGPVSPSASAAGAFNWTWDPKVHVVSSAGVGNRAYVNYMQRPDGAGYIGQLPARMLLSVPKGTGKLLMEMKTSVKLGAGDPIPLNTFQISIEPSR